MIPADVGDRPRGGATEPNVPCGMLEGANTGPDHVTNGSFPLPTAEPEPQGESTPSYGSHAFL